MNSEEEPPTEMGFPLVERFIESYTRAEAKRRKTIDRILSKFMKNASGEDTLLRELASAFKAYIGEDEMKLKNVLSQFPDDWQHRINKYYPFLPSGINSEHKCIRMAELIIKYYTKDRIMEYISDLRLEASMNASETTTWRAFELKKNLNDPMIEFNERPILPTLSDDELTSWHRNVKFRLQKALSSKHQSSHVIAQVSQKNEFMMVGVWMARELPNKQYEFTSWVAALVPQFPFVCFHGNTDDIIELNELVKILPGKYQMAYDLNLIDEGLGSVYSSLLKIPSSTMRQSEEFRRRLSTVNKPQLAGSLLQSLPVDAIATVVAQSDLIMKLAIDDGQPGGFKTLNLQYEVANLDSPITVSFKGIEGSLDKCIRKKYTARSWPNPSPYVTAKDRKTNHVALRNSADGFVVVPNDNQRPAC